MNTILDLISNEVKAAFQNAGYDAAYGKVTLSNRPDLCEYQCNGAMAAAKAYRKAYPNGAPHNSSTESTRLMRKPEIRSYIESIQQEIEDSLMFDSMAIIRKYIDIAFLDIFDLVEVQSNGYTKVKEDADGQLIDSIKNTPFGAEVDIPSRMEALKELAKRFGLDESDFRKELELARLDILNRRIDLQELKEKGDEEALEKLDAILKGIDKEVNE